MSNRRTVGNTVMILTGLTAGGVTGLLLARRNGRRTRREIAQRMESAQGYVTDLGEELIRRGQTLVERAREGVG